MKCPYCNSDIIQKSSNKLKIRTNIIIFEKAQGSNEHKAVIKCPKCKKIVDMPILLDTKSDKLKHVIVE